MHTYIHLLQVSVLRRALQELAVMGLEVSGGADAVAASRRSSAADTPPTLFERAKNLSDRILELVHLGEAREKEMKEGDAALKRLREMVETLQTEKSTLLEQCQDLKLWAPPRGGGGRGDDGSLERELGRRLLAVSEDLKTTKLTLLQTRRQVGIIQVEVRRKRGIHPPLFSAEVGDMCYVYIY